MAKTSPAMATPIGRFQSRQHHCTTSPWSERSRPFGFEVLRNPQSDGRVDDLEDDQRDNDVVNEHDGDAFDLLDDLGRIASIGPGVPPNCSIANTPVRIADVYAE